MPRSTIANRVGQIHDGLLALYSIAGAAISATTTGASIQFDATKLIDYDMIVSQLAVTGFVAGTAYWSVAIQAATTQGGTYTTISSVDLGATQGKKFLPLNGMQVNGLVPGATWLRVVATKVGTPGNLQFGAFLTETT
jgi:hypothetical protein